ncbi:VanZ family protein [Chitinophaga sp. sic0106]|uniref:VanZ family protein n=1 Tax=Chitinophaga sp. sic0106 TaxID=2854785 RepID=UPI001C4479E6|nr:VanZ family protein [Chitinophaga sp. sic0106]MBV7533679.1 VanZ family protein [Chitinophaga sp. sic0106]
MKKRFFLPVTIWVILILVLCTMPGKDVPTNSFLEKIHFDKIVHFGLFGGIVFFLNLAIYWQKKKVSTGLQVLFVLFAASYGLAIEFIQKYYAEGRSFDLVDAVADTIGAIAGVFVFKIFISLITKKKQSAGK